jgi:hypothetical protein
MERDAIQKTDRHGRDAEHHGERHQSQEPAKENGHDLGHVDAPRLKAGRQLQAMR